MSERKDISTYFAVAITVVCICFISLLPYGSVGASDIVDTVETVEEEIVEDVVQDEVSDTETDMEVSPVIVQDELIFEMMEFDTLGVATLSDVYNVLVAIYNLGLMTFIVFLIIWTYNMITKAFRRFIY